LLYGQVIPQIAVPTETSTFRHQAVWYSAFYLLMYHFMLWLPVMVNPQKS